MLILFPKEADIQKCGVFMRNCKENGEIVETCYSKCGGYYSLLELSRE
jgi:hypothetical protein